MDSAVGAGLTKPPVLSMVRNLSADSIVFLSNQQLVDHGRKTLTRRIVNDAGHGETLFEEVLDGGILHNRGVCP